MVCGSSICEKRDKTHARRIAIFFLHRICTPIPRHCQPRRHLLAERRSKWKKATNSPASRLLYIFWVRRHPSDISLLNELVDNHHLIVLFQDDLQDWPTLHACLTETVHLESLLCLPYTRGAFSSGFSWDQIRPIIETDVRIHAHLAWIKTGFTIHAGWVTCYTGIGVFSKWHRDKGCGGGTHHIIFMVGAYEKTMRFKRAGESGEISVFLPHNSFVALSMVGGGVIRTKKGERILHMVNCAHNSITVTIQASRK